MLPFQNLLYVRSYYDKLPNKKVGGVAIKDHTVFMSGEAFT